MQDAHRSQQEAEREILRALLRQWQIECELLPTPLSQQLRPPQLLFKNMGTRWAYWDHEARLIAFSRQLISKPWSVLRAVLRHEMGHQLADECLEGSQQTPHGPAFKAACRLLQTECAANADHPAYQQHTNTTTQGRIMRRVEKLLALAGGSNQHEAESAMTKAHQLIRQYHLDMISETAPATYISQCLGRPAQRRQRYYYALANLLQDHYFVSTIWIYCALPEKDKPGTILEISGTPNDVELAAYVYDFVLLHLERLWRNYRMTTQVSGHRKTDFAIGLIHGFSENLNKTAPQETAAQTALLSLADKRLASYQKQRYPRTSTIQRSAKTDHSVLKAGQQHGRNLKLYKGIPRKSNQRTHLLTAPPPN